MTSTYGSRQHDRMTYYKQEFNSLKHKKLHKIMQQFINTV